jgi:hypothetical protein
MLASSAANSGLIRKLAARIAYSIHRGRLEPYEELRPREPRDAEQTAREALADAVEALRENAEVLKQSVDVGQ